MLKSILFLALGIACILLAQIDVAHFRYVKKRLGPNDFARSIRMDNRFNSLGHKIWLTCLILLGAGALFISARAGAATIQFPLILAFILGFMLWIILLQFSLKLFVNTAHRPSIHSFIIAFALPLILVALVGIAAALFPDINTQSFNNQYN